MSPTSPWTRANGTRGANNPPTEFEGGEQVNALGIVSDTAPALAVDADGLPHVAYQARPKATPSGTHNPHLRVRHDRVRDGRVSLRHNGHMHHIGLGRTLDGTRIILLIDDLDIRVIHHHTGEIIRHLTLDPNRHYHGTGTPPGGPNGTRKPQRTNPK